STSGSILSGRKFVLVLGCPRSRCGGGIHSVSPLSFLRVVHPPSSTRRLSGPQASVSSSMFDWPPLAHRFVAWCTSHQYGGTSQPGRVHPRSVAYSTSRCAGVANRVVRPL